jgi:hypothetical protein
MPSSRPKRTAIPRPIKDEWGVYDPSQAGLVAVLQRMKSRPPVPEAEGLSTAKRTLLELLSERKRGT